MSDRECLYCNGYYHSDEGILLHCEECPTHIKLEKERASFHKESTTVEAKKKTEEEINAKK